MAQFARPDSDISNAGGFSASSGSDLYAMLDEATASDSDYIGLTTFQTSYQVCVIGLSDVTDPISSINHILRARVIKSSSGGAGYAARIRLLQGTTEIVSVEDTSVSESGDDMTDTLNSTEIDSITDYTDLRIEFGVRRVGGAPLRQIRFTWGEFEVPDAPAGGGGHAGQLVNGRLLKSKFEGALVQ